MTDRTWFTEEPLGFNLIGSLSDPGVLIHHCVLIQSLVESSSRDPSSAAISALSFSVIYFSKPHPLHPSGHVRLLLSWIYHLSLRDLEL